MSQDSKRIAQAPCPGDPDNCEVLLSSQEAYRERYGKADISGHEAVVSAMAVGLVIDVWRNGPVEDMHCGKRGPDDAAIFAESTSLHDRAVRPSPPATARSPSWSSRIISWIANARGREPAERPSTTSATASSDSTAGT